MYCYPGKVWQLNSCIFSFEKMKKFLLKIVCFCMILLILIGILNLHYINTRPPDYLDKYNNIKTEIEIANVGSSHGLWGFCYEKLEEHYNCFNFAMESQSLSYDYQLLEQYKEHLENGGILFVTLSYFSFFWDEEKQSDFEAKNTRYYRILKSEYIKNYSFMNDICYHYFPVLGSQEGILKILTRKSQGKNIGLENWERTAEELDVWKNAAAAVERHITSNRNSAGELMRNPNEVAALYKIINLCEEKNLRVILITTPYLQEYNEQVPADCLENFHAIIREIQRETSVEYYNYANDIRFTDDYQLFMNSDHLNKKGAMKFTSILWEEVCQ